MGRRGGLPLPEVLAVLFGGWGLGRAGGRGVRWKELRRSGGGGGRAGGGDCSGTGRPTAQGRPQLKPAHHTCF